jgi:hypothetical protein
MNQELIRDITQIVVAACKSANNKFGYGIWSHHIKTNDKNIKTIIDRSIYNAI